jgi:hypothetical protein
MIRKFFKFDAWTQAIVLYLYLGFVLGKASAYLGLLVGGFMLFSTRILWDRWFKALTNDKDVLHTWSWAFLVSLLYGFAQTIIGQLRGYPLVTTMEILAFNLYPAYLFLGIWIGMRHPGLLRNYIRYSAWLAVVYAPLYFLVFRKLTVSLSGLLPGNDMAILGNPGSGSATILALIAYEPNLLKFWLPLLVCACLTIANQERSDWIGMILALAIWGLLAKRMTRVFQIGAIIAAILIFAALIDLKLPAVAGRGGELSARGTISRMAGSISPELAREVGGDNTNAAFYYGTVYWRERWWSNIRYELGKSYQTMIFGEGYGFNLAHLANRDVERQGTRSPHDILYFCYAYSGLVGVFIFVWMTACLFWVLWRVFKATGIIYALAYLALQIVLALFGNFIETPQAGIMVYFTVGLAIAPYFLRQDVTADLEDNGPYLEEASEFHYPEMEPARGD